MLDYNFGDFWFEYLNTKEINRVDKVKELVRHSLLPGLKDSDDVTVHAVASLLNSYFEDLKEELEDH